MDSSSQDGCPQTTGNICSDLANACITTNDSTTASAAVDMACDQTNGSAEELGLPAATVSRFQTKFLADPKNILAQNVCARTSVLDVMRKPSVENTPHLFNHKIEAEGKPVTNQHSSGRCWIFAMLNCMRIPFMKANAVDDFEFSQCYLFFWDKIERLHYRLRAYVESARQCEPVEGRLVQFLLENPAEDGGQWQMLVNLVEKYGVVPKRCFPDTWSCENSRRLNSILNNKMREYCSTLRAMVVKGTPDEEINAEIEGMMEVVYRIISICTGSPPEQFTWQYYDKEKKYRSIGPISPIDFYRQYIKPHYNILDKVVLVNDPRPTNPYGVLYTVEYLNNMVGSPPVLYINQPADVLKKCAADSIKGNEAVWFGSDVNQHCSWPKFGLEDLALFDHELVFGTSVLQMSKADRLIHRESLMTHAMVLTAVKEKDTTELWRIENSWSETGGDKGYMAMTDDWFTEFVFEVVVDKKFLPPEVLSILSGPPPKVLPAWDPMGALARALPSFPSGVKRVQSDEAALRQAAQL